jgi:hypothetical protein
MSVNNSSRKFNNDGVPAAILSEKETRLLQDKALRNDGLRKLVLSLRAERSNLKGFQFHRELLVCQEKWLKLSLVVDSTHRNLYGAPL